MSIKYYAHFVLKERMPRSMNEFRGVIEVNHSRPYDDVRKAASILAKSFECDSRDIAVLHWSLLQ